MWVSLKITKHRDMQRFFIKMGHSSTSVIILLENVMDRENIFMMMVLLSMKGNF